MTYTPKARTFSGVDADQQIQSFEEALDKLVKLYADEYDLSIAAIVGCLQIKSHLLCEEANEPDAQD